MVVCLLVWPGHGHGLNGGPFGGLTWTWTKLLGHEEIQGNEVFGDETRQDECK